MTVLLTCDRYRVIREVPFGSDLPALCREEEARRNDGYAVVASTDGEMVADADGYFNQRMPERDPFLDY